ncbi:AraC family transcriptional regulator [Erwinia psidii]|uniref:AraC family transcriptional regulator n=1 Tax=Erwinia psidii TaxID=69224 RepID=A0A3N6TX42_9GAMM|nr:AraC family transcriptional regulator [Erwinia psidii]MCX8956503.1 AraC family transcriptional regulator [Erwinia psidii]MCX8961587.1 AraC family transcriptional regulator [Erwinia psidii]RQM39832.1 AraC family transcriptional regulator [Erwinia psidii]
MLSLSISHPLKVQNGGLFISRGTGTHPGRTLSSYELIYVISGTLSLREEQRIFTLKKGESLLLFPGRKHQGISTFDKALKFYWLHFDMLYSHQENPSLQLTIPQHCQVADEESLLTLFRLFLNEQERGDRSYSLELLLILILQEIMRIRPAMPAENDAGAALAWQAKKLIATQFHLPIGATELAQRLHCNVDYLGRVYRQTFSMTLTQALHQQRIMAAEKMLLSNAVTLSEVAALCGFNDAAYFRRVFRKLRSTTPAAWRRRYCREHINSD